MNDHNKFFIDTDGHDFIIEAPNGTRYNKPVKKYIKCFVIDFVMNCQNF